MTVSSQILRARTPTRNSPFQTASGNRFKCFSREFPLRSQTNESGVECSDSSGESLSPVRTVPQTNRSRYSLNCLHRYCEVPRIPENLPFSIRPLEKEWYKWRALESTYMNAWLVFWVGFHYECSLPLTSIHSVAPQHALEELSL